MRFKTKLLLAWAIVVLGAVGLMIAAVVASKRSIASELSRARVELMAATDSVVGQLGAMAAAGTSAESLWAAGGGLLDLQLEERSGVEGGVWADGHGFVAYTFPTYDGGTPKTQLPAAELPQLKVLAENAAAASGPQLNTVVGEREALIRVAQPLPGATPSLVVWTMKRVPIGAARLLSTGAMAAGALSLLIVLVGLWLAWTLSRWNASLQRIGQVLAVRPIENMPEVMTSGTHELDVIASAINAMNVDLREARNRAASLTRRLAGAERLAAVGRVSAGMAHEIRNPLAAIRLRAENALADADHPKTSALERILEEVDRLEHLVRTLLDLGREIRVVTVPTDVQAWVRAHVQSLSDKAAAANVKIETDAVGAATWSIDPAHLGRALDNLLTNAIQAAPPDSVVAVHAKVDGNELYLAIADRGGGIAEGLEDRIFEPFFTTREGGTGLGLALVREIVEAHGGSVSVRNGVDGAIFEMRLPCHASW